MSKRVEREVDEELQFHLDMLSEKYLRNGMTAGEARELSRKSFGDLEEIKNECLNIRQLKLRRTLAFLFSLLFAGGVILRTFASDRGAVQLADLSMVIAVLGHGFMYVRGLSPSHFLSKASGNSIFKHNVANTKSSGN